MADQVAQAFGGLSLVPFGARPSAAFRAVPLSRSVRGLSDQQADGRSSLLSSAAAGLLGEQGLVLAPISRRAPPNKALQLPIAGVAVSWHRRPLLASLAGRLVLAGGGAWWATVPGQRRSQLSADPLGGRIGQPPLYGRDMR
jgi:hypothetical protein